MIDIQERKVPMRQIPILICIDVEPDERAFDPHHNTAWNGFPASYELFSRFRESLQRITDAPVHFSWFLKMDPQIATTHGTAAWVAEHYRDLVQKLESAGDHLGLHVHPWRWDERAHIWIEDYADPAWVQECVHVGVSAFKPALDRPCRSFRFGDRWMNNAAMAYLERLGIDFDLTIEPGQKGNAIPESFRGDFPDATDVPLKPYHPSRADFTKPGTGDGFNLWCIPVSSGSIYSPRVISERHLASTTFAIGRRQKTITGTLTASPNPILVAGLADPGVTTLNWWADGTENVQVRVNAPDGPLFAEGGSAGSLATGKWVTNGMVFYLQDVSGGLSLTRANTLATTRVYVTVGEACAPAGREGEAYMTLNLAFNSLVFVRIMDHLIDTLEEPYLAIVMRTDTAIQTDQRWNLDQTLDYLAQHPWVERFAFETPPEMIRRFK